MAILYLTIELLFEYHQFMHEMFIYWLESGKYYSLRYKWTLQVYLPDDDRLRQSMCVYANL